MKLTKSQRIDIAIELNVRPDNPIIDRIVSIIDLFGHDVENSAKNARSYIMKIHLQEGDNSWVMDDKILARVIASYAAKICIEQAKIKTK